MKRATLLGAITNANNISALFEKYSVFAPSGFSKYLFSKGVLQLAFEPVSQELQAAINDLKMLGVSFRLRSVTRYTKKELENVEYFYLRVRDPLELQGVSAEDFGTEYIGGCPQCGIGKVPNGAVLADRKYIVRHQFATLVPDYYVSAPFRNFLEENRFTGLSFQHDVKDYKGREMEPYYTLDVTHVLEPFSQSTWVEKDYGHPIHKNSSCSHYTIYLCSDLQYERSKLRDAKDFNLTHEYLNNDHMRGLVVSARVRKALIANGHRFFFEPVFIIDD